MKTFETFQPGTVSPNSITYPTVFNGICLIRKYKITTEQVEEPKSVLVERLRDLWNRRREYKITHPDNIHAMVVEAEKLGVELR